MNLFPTPLELSGALVAALLAAVGCQSEQAASREDDETPAALPAKVETPPPAPPTPAGAATPAAVASSRATAEVAGHVAELRVTDSSVAVTVTEPNGAPPESAENAALVLQIGGARREVALSGSGGRFSGTVDLRGVTSFVAILRLELDGQPRTCRFAIDRARVDPVPADPVAPDPGHGHGAHEDHAGRHGGVLLMSGDHHFEVVLDRAHGQHRVYMSDAVREAVDPTRFRGSITVRRSGAAPERLELVPAGEFLSARGQSVAGEADAVVELDLGGSEPYSIEVQFPG
jgi:hypothetical protein